MGTKRKRSTMNEKGKNKKSKKSKKGGQRARCSACRWSRARCDRHCLLADYFPNENVRSYREVQRWFGRANVERVMVHINEGDQDRFAEFFSAFCLFITGNQGPKRQQLLQDMRAAMDGLLRSPSSPSTGGHSSVVHVSDQAFRNYLEMPISSTSKDKLDRLRSRYAHYEDFESLPDKGQVPLEENQKVYVADLWGLISVPPSHGYVDNPGRYYISNGEVINYSRLLKERAKIYYSICWNSLYLHGLSSGASPVYGWVRDRSQEITESSNLRFIFCPLLAGDVVSDPFLRRGGHWLLLVCDVREKCFMHFNSLSMDKCHEDLITIARENLTKALVESGVSRVEEPWVMIEGQCPKQPNGHDCGVYMLALMDLLSLKGDGYKLLHQSQIPNLRDRFLVNLVYDTIDLTDELKSIHDEQERRMWNGEFAICLPALPKKEQQQSRESGIRTKHLIVKKPQQEGSMSSRKSVRIHVIDKDATDSSDKEDATSKLSGPTKFIYEVQYGPDTESETRRKSKRVQPETQSETSKKSKGGQPKTLSEPSKKSNGGQSQTESQTSKKSNGGQPQTESQTSKNSNDGQPQQTESQTSKNSDGGQHPQ